MQMIQAHSNKH